MGFHVRKNKQSRDLCIELFCDWLDKYKNDYFKMSELKLSKDIGKNIINEIAREDSASRLKFILDNEEIFKVLLSNFSHFEISCTNAIKDIHCTAYDMVHVSKEDFVEYKKYAYRYLGIMHADTILIPKDLNIFNQLKIILDDELKKNINNGIDELETHITKKRKKVRCVETGEIFESAAEASRYLGSSEGSASNYLRGRAKSAGGFTWEEIGPTENE